MTDRGSRRTTNEIAVARQVFDSLKEKRRTGKIQIEEESKEQFRTLSDAIRDEEARQAGYLVRQGWAVEDVKAAMNITSGVRWRAIRERYERLTGEEIVLKKANPPRSDLQFIVTDRPYIRVFKYRGGTQRLPKAKTYDFGISSMVRGEDGKIRIRAHHPHGNLSGYPQEIGYSSQEDITEWLLEELLDDALAQQAAGEYLGDRRGMKRTYRGGGTWETEWIG